jgi:A/G-specific adenine glycosylase
MPQSPAYQPVVAWYADAARDLPWRRPDASPWAVLVSEVMLQQTPVHRVLPVYQAWLERWPTPSALAQDSVGDAIRAWGRLGYPRRAQRLWEAACVIDKDFEGEIPATESELRLLPGVGGYTAAAVCAFAYRRRSVVLDTNIRRVLARLVDGVEFAPAGLSVAEQHAAQRLVPDEGEAAATWSVALMELGALVCTARRPRCPDCPLRELCAWRARGCPAYNGPPRRSQTYTGTDRECRGRILALLRGCDGPVDAEMVRLSWDDALQRERAVDSLVRDRLVNKLDSGALALP